jgi:DNA-binding NarL/FixJ family response regulator
MSNMGDGRAPAASASEDAHETTVLIVDDHRCFADLLAAALQTVPGIRCLGTAGSAAEGIQRAAELSPSVVVMDIQMPGTDGLTATRQLRAASPDTAVVVVTAHLDREWIARAAQAGASAFIPKTGSLTDMITMLKEAKPGPMRVASSLTRLQAVQVTPGWGALGKLTERELETLGYLGQGLPTARIATAMGIRLYTCRGHIRAVYGKLGASNRIQAINRARQLQLLDT